MNLRQLSDQDLLSKTMSLAQRERELLTAVLHHLREIERRRLFSSLGYKSLFDYAVKELNYSQDQAYRRIQAMRTLCELPEIERKLQDGSVSLTSLSLAEKLFKAEKKVDKPLPKEKKIEILERLENKSTREAEKIVVSLLSQLQKIVAEKVRVISETEVEYRFTSDLTLQEKIDRLKGLLAHTHPGISTADLFHKLCDLGLEKWDLGKKKVKKFAAPVSQGKTQETAMPKVRNEGMTASTKREIWRRAQSQCENCQSTFALEIDHILPKSLGGSNDLQNLRLLCRSCNQRAAIKTLGLDKMEVFLEKKSRA